jgi:ketosteroid isomerase-like protein
MKRLLLLTALTSLAAPMVFGQAAAKKDHGVAAEQEIMKIRRDWYDAFFRGDTATMNRIETDDFVVVSDSGPHNKKSQLAGIQRAVKKDKWLPKGVTLVDENLNVRLHGSAAVISAIGWKKQPGQGKKPPEERDAFTEVWIKRDGRWKVMHLHFSPLDQAQSTRPSR